MKYILRRCLLTMFFTVKIVPARAGTETFSQELSSQPPSQYSRIFVNYFAAVRNKKIISNCKLACALRLISSSFSVYPRLSNPVDKHRYIFDRAKESVVDTTLSISSTYFEQISFGTVLCSMYVSIKVIIQCRITKHVLLPHGGTRSPIFSRW